MPHINPRFFPHLNVIPPQYPPHYQPPPPAPPVGYSYAAYYNSAGAPGYEPNYDFQSEWYEENERDFVSGHAAVESSPYRVRQRSEFKHEQIDRVAYARQDTTSSGLSAHSGSGSGSSGNTLTSRVPQSSQVVRRQQQQQQQGSATQQSAHYGSQLDTADTASDAGIGPQLLPSFMGADKGGVELEDHEAGKTGGDGVKEEKSGNGDEESEGKGKGKDPEGASMSDREDNDDLQKSGMEIGTEKGERELAVPASSQRIFVSETVPSNPRAMRSHRDSRYSNSSVAPSQLRRHPSEYNLWFLLHI